MVSQEEYFSELYKKALTILKKRGVEWIVNEVEQTIAEGFTFTYSNGEYSYESRPRFLNRFHTSKEKFYLLIDAIERATLDAQDIERQVIKDLINEVQNHKTLLQAEIIFRHPDIEEDTEILIKYLPNLDESIKYLKDLDEHFEYLKTKLGQIRNYSNLDRFFRDDKKYYDWVSILDNERLWFNLEVDSQYNYQDYVADIFLLIIKAARSEGATVEYCDKYGQPVRALEFRQSPGQIYTKDYRFTHAVLQFPNCDEQLEVHVGIRCQGQSNVLHECDICVLPHEEAEFCRERECSPVSEKIVIACECKYYSSNLNLNIARSFMGLDSDLNVEGSCYLVSNSESKSVAKLLTQSRKKWAHNVFPSSTNDVDRLRYSFQRDFQEFKTRYSR